MTEYPTQWMDDERITELLGLLDEALSAQGARATIRMIGGAALIASEGLERATTDIDYVPVAGDTGTLARTAAETGRTEKLGRDWFSTLAARTGVLPDETGENERSVFKGRSLEVTTPSTKTLVAMKLLAMSGRRSARDIDDVAHLAKRLNIRNRTELAETLLAAYDETYKGKHPEHRDRTKKNIETVMNRPDMVRYTGEDRTSRTGIVDGENPSLRGADTHETKKRGKRERSR